MGQPLPMPSPNSSFIPSGSAIPVKKVHDPQLRGQQPSKGPTTNFVPEGAKQVSIVAPADKPLGVLHQFLPIVQRRPLAQPAVPPPPKVPPVATGFEEPEPEDERKASEKMVEQAMGEGDGRLQKMVSRMMALSAERAAFLEKIEHLMVDPRVQELEDENRSLIAIVARQRKELDDLKRNAQKA